MPNRLHWLWKCVILPKLNFILENSYSCMFRIGVGHKRNSCVGLEGCKRSSSHLVAHPQASPLLRPLVLRQRPSCNFSVSLRSVFSCSASWTKWMCLACWQRALASARHLYHKGQNQQEWSWALVCPPKLHVLPEISCFFFSTLCRLLFPNTFPAYFKPSIRQELSSP